MWIMQTWIWETKEVKKVSSLIVMALLLWSRLAKLLKSPKSHLHMYVNFDRKCAWQNDILTMLHIVSLLTIPINQHKNLVQLEKVIRLWFHYSLIPTPLGSPRASEGSGSIRSASQGLRGPFLRLTSPRPIRTIWRLFIQSPTPRYRPNRHDDRGN